MENFFGCCQTILSGQMRTAYTNSVSIARSLAHFISQMQPQQLHRWKSWVDWGTLGAPGRDFLLQLGAGALQLKVVHCIGNQRR